MRDTRPLRALGDLRLFHGRGRRTARDRRAGRRRAAEIPDAAHRLVFGTRPAAGGSAAAVVRLHQAGRLGRGAGAADVADDQPAPLQGRSGRHHARHHGAVSAQAVGISRALRAGYPTPGKPGTATIRASRCNFFGPNNGGLPEMDYFCPRYEDQTRADGNPRLHCGICDLPARIGRAHLARDPQLAAYRSLAGGRPPVVELPEKHDHHRPRRRERRGHHPRSEDPGTADQLRAQLRPERPELGCAGRKASALRNPASLRRTDCKTAHRPNLRPADRGAGQRLVLPAVRGRLDRHGHRLHLDARGFRRQTAYAGTRREPLPDLHHLGVHGVAVRLGSPEVRLFGGNGARDERPVPRTGGTAHQWRDRHRRGAHPDRVQPPDQRPAAYHLHRHRPVGDIVNG